MSALRDRRRALRLALVAVAVASGWLLLAGSVEIAEVVVAGVVGAAAAAGGARLRTFVGHEHRGSQRWVRHLPGVLGQAYVDCWTLTRVLARCLRGRPTSGRFRKVDYRVGTDDADDVGRRILTVFGVTLQPNSYLVTFDDDDTALVHELVPTPHGPIARDLRGR